MRNFTKSLLALALMFVCVGGAKAKTELSLPGPWGDGIKDGSNYTFNGTWQGAATGVWGDWSGAEYEYVWVKYTGFTGKIQLKIEYDEWKKKESWGDVYDQQTVSFVDGSGYLGIAIDKQTTFEYGSVDGAHKGEIYAKHIRQIIIQDAGAASTITIDKIYVGTEVEYEEDCGITPTMRIVGETELVTNGDFEGNDVSSFNVVEEGSGFSPTIFSGIGKDGSRGIKVNATANCVKAWDTQFNILLPEELHEGAKVKFEFDYRASIEATRDIQCANKDYGYMYWMFVGSSPSFTTSWKHYNQEGTIVAAQDGMKIVQFNLSKQGDGDIQVGQYFFDNISVVLNEKTVEARRVNVGESGFASFSANKAVDMEGYVSAYAAKYFGGKIVLTPVTKIPAGVGVIVEAAKGSHKVPVIESAEALGTINELSVSDGTATGDGTHVFALGKKDDKVGFVKVKSGVIIPAGKAYLYIATPPTSRDFLGFGEDDTTGIESVEQAAKVDNQYFNLAGQRVAQPTKGLYIVNGKKVIIK